MSLLTTHEHMDRSVPTRSKEKSLSEYTAGGFSMSDGKKAIITVIITVLIAIVAGAYLAVYGIPGIEQQAVEPVLELTEQKVIIHTGDTFNPKDYIQRASDENGRDILNRISTAELNTELEGTYDVVYQYVVDDTVEIEKKLKVIVTEK